MALPALVSILFHGTAYGMVLYLISVGLSITMGLMGFANLAHGVFAMAGGYMATSLMNAYGMPLPFALLTTFAGTALLGLLLERALYSRFYGAGELVQVLLSIGLVFAAVAIARLTFGAQAQRIMLPQYLQGQLTVLGRDLVTYRAFLIVFSALLILALWLTIERTRWGAVVRAAVDNRDMAQSVGIDTSRVFMLTFALGSGLAGLGGALGADLLAIQPTYPMEHLVFFLVVVALGGLGSLRGPFVAALLIGLGDTACKYLAPQVGSFFVYLVVIVVLAVRPNGLLGVTGAR
jgi:branched-chain amino acid transport system permease protein